MITFKFKQIEDTNGYKYEIFYNDKLITKDELLQNKDKWLGIAEKNPLNGIAFIQELAGAGDIDTAFLQCIYQTFKKFLENGETNQFEKLCDIILKRSKTPSLKFYLATYIQTLLNEETSNDPEVIRAKNTLHTLIPGFEKVFFSNVYKIHQEKIIRIPEMENKHNAFPDLFKFNDIYYIAFRDANSHVNYEDLGGIRILKGSYSSQKKSWNFENHQLLSDKDYDLRDPRFFVNAENKLMLIIGGSKIDEEHKTVIMVPQVATLEGDSWKIQPVIIEPEKNAQKGQWIWHVTWNPYDNRGYALSYGISKQLSLVQTKDGVHFEKIVDLSTDKVNETFNEATIRFKEDGTMVALIRAQKQGLIATSSFESGYKTFEFHPLDIRLGGPNFLIRPDGGMVAGTRYFFLEKDNTLDLGTVVAFMDEKSLIPLLRLQSKLDNSYPGMVLEDHDEISFLYYSTGETEGICDLYITRVKL